MVMEQEKEDVLARLKAARMQSQSSTSSKFFWIKDGEKALVRVLRNHQDMVAIRSHRRYNADLRKYDIHAVCAKEFDQECQYCLDAQKEWKLKVKDMFYQPVYVHTKVGEDGQPREINQLLYLEMPDSDGILAGLEGLYYAEDDPKARDITKCDLVISRVKAGGKSIYSVTARHSAPLPLPNDITVPDASTITADVEGVHQMKVIEEDETSARPSDPFAPTSVQDAQPQFTVKEALDMKEPTELQLNAIQKLCKSLDKDFIAPISFGQAANMLRNLKEEFTASLAEE